MSHSGFANWVERQAERNQRLFIHKAQPGGYERNSTLLQPLGGRGGGNHGDTDVTQASTCTQGTWTTAAARPGRRAPSVHTTRPVFCVHGAALEAMPSPAAKAASTLRGCCRQPCLVHGPTTHPPRTALGVVHTERELQAVLRQEPHGVVPAQARELHEGR